MSSQNGYKVVRGTIAVITVDEYPSKSAYHIVVGEERVCWPIGSPETGILSAPDLTPLRGVAVKLATKRSSLQSVPQQPIAPDIL